MPDDVELVPTNRSAIVEHRGPSGVDKWTPNDVQGAYYLRSLNALDIVEAVILPQNSNGVELIRDLTQVRCGIESMYAIMTTQEFSMDRLSGCKLGGRNSVSATDGNLDPDPIDSSSIPDLNKPSVQARGIVVNNVPKNYTPKQIAEEIVDIYFC